MKLPLWYLICGKVALDATRASEMHLVRNVVLLLFGCRVCVFGL